MQPILIFRHVACEGPGYLGEFLQRHNLSYRVIAIDEDETVPDSLGDAPALVFMGGPMSVNDPLPWIERELALIREAVTRGIPVLGHCLGGQLISKALGGNVTRNRVKEIGWLPVFRAPQRQPLAGLADLPQTFEAFHWHGETFSLPDDANLLLSSEACAHQAFSIGNALALQFHVEVTAEMVEEWASLSADELAAPTATIQSRENMTKRLDTRIAQLHRVADVFYHQWTNTIK